MTIPRTLWVSISVKMRGSMAVPVTACAQIATEQWRTRATTALNPKPYKP